MNIASLKLEKEEELFEKLIQEYPKSWEQIYKEISLFKENHPIYKGLYPTSMTTELALNMFEKMGLDYSYRDIDGKNFLEFCYYCQAHHPKDCIRTYNNLLLDKIALKINPDYDYNQINKEGQNIVFDLVGRYNREWDLTDFLQHHPEVSLNKINNQGRNLLGHAILNMAEESSIKLLMEKNSIHHLDNDGNNLLSLFNQKYFMGYNRDIFKMLLKELDIVHVNHDGKAQLEIFFDDYIALKDIKVKGINDDRDEVRKKEETSCFINIVTQSIIDEEFYYTSESIKLLYELMEKNKAQYLNILSSAHWNQYTQGKNNQYKINFEKALSHLNKLYIESQLDVKNEIRKIKI